MEAGRGEYKHDHEDEVEQQQVLAVIEADDNLGFCLDSGAEAYRVEPDARKVPGKNQQSQLKGLKAEN